MRKPEDSPESISLEVEARRYLAAHPEIRAQLIAVPVRLQRQELGERWYHRTYEHHPDLDSLENGKNQQLRPQETMIMFNYPDTMGYKKRSRRHGGPFMGIQPFNFTDTSMPQH